MSAGSPGLLPTEGVFNKDIGDADADIKGGTPTDEVADINFGGPDVIRGGLDP